MSKSNKALGMIVILILVMPVACTLVVNWKSLELKGEVSSQLQKVKEMAEQVKEEQAIIDDERNELQRKIESLDRQD